MRKDEKVQIALYTFNKGYNFEQMKYSDILYGKEKQADNIWKLVEEISEIGLESWKNKHLFKK